MLRNLFLLFFFMGCSTLNLKEKPCQLGNGSCPENHYCAQVDKESYCILKPKSEKTVLQFPFASGYPVQCLRGVGKGSHHEFFNYFAVNLASMPGTPAGKVFAAEGGEARVYNDCPGTDNASYEQPITHCGAGLGNHIRIFHPDGSMTVYGHLSQILIEDGKTVYKGQHLGWEGGSGDTRLRGLHFSYHRPLDSPYLKTRHGFTGQSLPFSFKIGTSESDVIKEVQVEDLPCQSGNSLPPLIYGVWN